MSKRRTESTSSSSTECEDYITDTDCSSQSSIDDPSFTLGSCGQKNTKKSQQATSANERKSSVGLKQKEQTSVVSASTQLQSELGNIVKKEIEEMEVEHNGLKSSAEQRMRVDCSSSAIGQQAKLKVRRSKRQRVGSKDPKQQPQQPPSQQPSKKVCVSNPHEKYFEGCLVKAPLYLPGYPLWPGMIRKPGAYDVRHSDCIVQMYGETDVCVQFFTELTVVRWRAIEALRVFDPTKPNRCYSSEMDPTEVEQFEKAVRIAKAAANYSVEARLAKFTFPDSYPDLNKLDMDELLAEIESVNSNHNAAAAEASQNDAVSFARDDAALARVKNRVLDTKRKLRETEEANRTLTTENSQLGEKINELEVTVRDLKRQLNLHSGLSTVVITLQENLKLKDSALKAQEKDILKLRAEKLELQGNLEKEREEKQECQKKLEKMCSEFQKLEELLEDEVNEGGT